MVRRGVDDDLDVVAFHEFPHIVKNGGHLAAISKLVGGGGGVSGIDVANGDDVAEAFGIGSVATALAAAADEGDGGSVIGA